MFSYYLPNRSNPTATPNAQPRLFPMNSPQSHFGQPAPPSPPLPPPPPPPPSTGNTIQVQDHIIQHTPLRSTTTTTVNARPNAFVVNDREQQRDQRENRDSQQTFEKTPSPQVRRSLSNAKKDAELPLKADKLRTGSDGELVPRHQVLYRKPGNLFLAQLYFFFHLALTICLLRANGT